MTELHWSIEYVDDLGLDQVSRLFRYWSQHPPVHDMLHAKWFQPRKTRQVNSSNFGEAAKELGL